MTIGHIDGSSVQHILIQSSAWKSGWKPLCGTGRPFSKLVVLPGSSQGSCARCLKIDERAVDAAAQQKFTLEKPQEFYLKRAEKGVFSTYHLYADCVSLVRRIDRSTNLQPRTVSQLVIDELGLECCGTCEKRRVEESTLPTALGILTQILGNHQQDMYGKPPRTQAKIIAQRQIVALEEAGFRYIRAPKGDKD